MYIMKCGHEGVKDEETGNIVCPICMGLNDGAWEVDYEIPDDKPEDEEKENENDR